MWQRLGETSPGADLLDELMRRYGEPHRRYHTMQHLDECFAQIDLVHVEAVRPAEIELALWFHNAIYDVKNLGNEQQSAN